MDVMVSRCWPLDCCIASLFKLRPSFPGIASPLHLAGIGQRRNWKRSGIRFSPSRSQTRRQADGKCWEAPPGQGPPTVHCGPQQPPAHRQILGDRSAKVGATQGNSLPENLHTLLLTVSQWQPKVVRYSALLPRLCTQPSALRWTVCDPLTTQLSLWDFSSSHCCAMP